jgi:ornithine carbamoyltransferase
VATVVAARPISKVSVSNLVRDLDLTDDQVLDLFDLAAKVKRTPAKYGRALSGKHLSLLFEKPSLRTRLTFELAIRQLGGDAVVSEGPVNAVGTRHRGARVFPGHHRRAGALVFRAGR